MRSQPTLSLSLSLSPRNGPVTRVEGRLGGRSVAHVVLGSDRVDDVPGRQAVALRDPSLSSSAICFFFTKKKFFSKNRYFQRKNRIHFIRFFVSGRRFKFASIFTFPLFVVDPFLQRVVFFNFLLVQFELRPAWCEPLPSLNQIFKIKKKEENMDPFHTSFFDPFVLFYCFRSSLHQKLSLFFFVFPFLLFLWLLLIRFYFVKSFFISSFGFSFNPYFPNSTPFIF